MPKLIHVVDDDSSFRTAIQRRLLKAGYEVEIYAPPKTFSIGDQTRGGQVAFFLISASPI